MSDGDGVAAAIASLRLDEYRRCFYDEMNSLAFGVESRARRRR